MALTISELARTGGVGVETVRFYQRKGLLRDPRQGGGGRPPGQRHYDQDDVRRLRFIRSAKGAGFILNEIAELLELDASDDRKRVRAMAEARLHRLDAEIVQLERSREALRHLATQCAVRDAGPCPIIEAFEDSRLRG